MRRRTPGWPLEWQLFKHGCGDCLALRLDYAGLVAQRFRESFGVRDDRHLGLLRGKRDEVGECGKKAPVKARVQARFGLAHAGR